MGSDKRGFVFTLDAFMALALIALVIVVITYQLNIPSTFFPQHVQTYNYASDIVGTLSTLTIGELRQTSNLVQDNPSDTDTFYPPIEDDHIILEQLAKDMLSEEEAIQDRAEALAKGLLADPSSSSPLLPEQFGMKVSVKDSAGNWVELFVREKSFTKLQSTASFVLFGYLESRNPSSVSPYDYPPLDPDPAYCAGGGGTQPCTTPSGSDGYYEGGELLGPTTVRVGVWT